MAQSKACSPTCQSFKCAKNSALYRRDTVWCRETEEQCSVSNCTYSMCFKRRMLPGGICGETVKRKTIDKDVDDFFDGSGSVKIKGKALRKLGDQDFY